MEMERVDRLFQIFNIDPVRDKPKYKRCKRQFLAVRYEDGAVRFYGSYNVRCRLPLTECVNCRRYINVNVLIPAMVVEQKGLRKAIEELPNMCHGLALKLVEKYVMPNIDCIVDMLDGKEEVRLL